MTTLSDLTRPIIGIENRTPQEAFDIMCDRIRSALVASPSPQGMDGWQDISTAPTNGIRVDLWNGVERVPDCFCHQGTWRTVDSDYPIEATHWMRQPNPPGGKGGE